VSILNENFAIPPARSLISIVSSLVSAVIPSPEEDYIEVKIDLNKDLQHKESLN
jgi:hypothetical protein